MPENDKTAPERPEANELSENLIKIAARSHKLITDFLAQQPDPETAELDPLNIGSAFLEFTNRMMADPSKLVEHQMSLWQNYMQLWQNTALHMMGEQTKPLIEPGAGDKRFRHKDWTENQVFNFIKQSYLLSANHLQNLASSVEGLDEKTRKKVDFYTRQFVDAMSPTNFALTNPEVLAKTVETKGENLVKGLENLLDDMERGRGNLAIKMTDLDAFEVGRNLATTPGKVVFQNDLIQLIQYEAATREVYKTPILIIPPWINKFYILDLKPQNSLVKWLVEQGYTVFMISWRNPDGSMRGKGFEQYMLEGPLAALEAIEKATGEASIAAIGYCVGGTLLAATLAYLTAKKQKNRIVSATFFVAQIDFTEAGELSLFVDEEQIAAMHKAMDKKGYLDASAMSTTFNMLRSNDLVWSFVVNNYLLGEAPFPFDLLYWNSDSTRLPKANHEFYLREMYLENNLVKPGKVKLDGTPIDLGKITVPSYIQAAKTDHICPPQSVYKAMNHYKGEKRFVLAGSGHIAGVINPPAAHKYQYWTNDAAPATYGEWLAGATEHPGSWWPDWHQWQAPRSGKMVPARKPGKGLKVIEEAPGSYVKVRSD
jgi:polyhydroxyalkanoate synthase